MPIGTLFKKNNYEWMTKIIKRIHIQEAEYVKLKDMKSNIR